MVDLGSPAAVRVTLPTPPAVVRAEIPTPPAVAVVPVAGPAGPPGAPGGAVYAHTQTEPAATWLIQHGLGRYPPVVLLLDSHPGEPVTTDLTYLDADTISVEWPTPETGTAYI